MLRLILAAAFAALSLPAFAQVALAGAADDVIAANKAAMGGAAWDSKASMTAEYSYAGQGMTGSVQSLTDLTAPRFADSYAIGPATGGNGFDGTRAWQKDASGQVTYQEGTEQRETAISEAYRRSNTIWRADRGGAQVTLASKSEGGRSYDVLTVVPRNGRAFEMWMDAQTHLVARIVEKQGADTYVTNLSDYRPVDGVQVAHRIVVGSGNAKYDTTLVLTKAAFGGPQPETAFAIPAVTKLDFSLRGGVRQTTVPFQLINNHIYADVSLNGRVFRLLVDTGGVNVVTPTVARALGLTMQGQMEGSGAGEGRVDVSLTKIDEVRVGEAIVKDQVFAVFPLESFADVEGVEQNGIVGYELFRRFVAKVDYGRGELTLIDPRHFDPARSGVMVPFVFSHHIPAVRGEIDGMPGEFHIDTGARSELVLTRPFVARHNLRSRDWKGVEAVTGWGVGGPSRGFVTIMGTLKLGGVEFDAPVTTFSTSERGAFAHATYAGNVGSGLLKQYVVTFDYGNQKMYFARGVRVERDGYDRAGMWINRAPDGFAVVDVTPKSPADVAGIRKDDVIVSVDGRRAAELSLIDVRRWFRNQPVGTVFHLGVRRGGVTRDLAVTLRDQVAPE